MNISSVYNEPSLLDWVLDHHLELPVLKNFPSIHSVNKVYHPHEIDLVLLNRENQFLIVELKFLSISSGKTACKQRNHHRKKVRKQAISHSETFMKYYPNSTVRCLGITDEDIREEKIKQRFLEQNIRLFVGCLSSLGEYKIFQEELINLCS
jgi:hypothetical protein